VRRVAVLGTTGVGKTTFARALAARLGVPHVELDALYHEAGWKKATDPVFRQRVTDATASDGWVTDGNYSRVRNIILARADAVVLLDLPFRVVFPRVVRRTFARTLSREPLWNGNRERLLGFADPQGPILWSIRTFRRRQREYAELFASPRAGLTVHLLRTAREVEEFLRSIAPPPARGSQVTSPSRARER
jgi:DNA helicase HerA-like ATPase